MAAIPPKAFRSMSPSSESGDMIWTRVLNASALMKKSSMRSSSLITVAAAPHSGQSILSSASLTVSSCLWPEGHCTVTLLLLSDSEIRSMSTAPMSRDWRTSSSP